jgi:hypothetical protein
MPDNLRRGRRLAAIVTQEKHMDHKKYCLVSGTLFSLVALAHLLRILFGMAVQVDAYAVPIELSWIGLIVPGALAIWAFRIGLAKSAT